MSDDSVHVELSDAVQRAAEEYVGSLGGMVTGMLGIVSYVNGDGERGWTFITGDDQSIVTSMGLQRLLDITSDAQAEAVILGVYDDEDDERT